MNTALAVLCPKLCNFNTYACVCQYLISKLGVGSASLRRGDGVQIEEAADWKFFNQSAASNKRSYLDFEGTAAVGLATDGAPGGPSFAGGVGGGNG